MHDTEKKERTLDNLQISRRTDSKLVISVTKHKIKFESKDPQFNFELKNDELPLKLDNVIIESDLTIKGYCNKLSVEITTCTIRGKLDVRGVNLKSFKALNTLVEGPTLFGLERKLPKQSKSYKRTRINFVELNNCNFKGTVNFGGIYSDRIRAQYTTFHDVLSFRITHEQDRDVADSLYDRKFHTKIKGSIDLHASECHGTLSFRGAHVIENIILTNTRLHGNVIFRPWNHDDREDTLTEYRDQQITNNKGFMPTVVNSLLASRTEIKGLLDMSGAVFLGTVDLRRATVGSVLGEPIHNIRVPKGQYNKDRNQVHSIFVNKEQWRYKVLISEDIRWFMWIAPYLIASPQWINTTKTRHNKQYHSKLSKPTADIVNNEFTKRDIQFKVSPEILEALKITGIRLTSFKNSMNRLRAESNSAKDCLYEIIDRTLTQQTDSWSQLTLNLTFPKRSKPQNEEKRIYRRDVLNHITFKEGKCQPFESFLTNLDPDVVIDGLFSNQGYHKLKTWATLTTVPKSFQNTLIYGKLDITGITCKGYVDFRGAFFFAGIRADNAVVDNNFSISAYKHQGEKTSSSEKKQRPAIPSVVYRLKLEPSNNLSVSAELLSCGGYFRISGSIFRNGINLVGATVKGSFFADSELNTRTFVGKATVPDSRLYSLRLSASSIGANVSIMGSYFSNAISLENAKVTGDIFGRSSWEANPDPWDLSERRTYVGPGLWSEQEKTSLLLNGLDLKGDLDLRGAFIDKGILLSRAKLNGHLLLDACDNPNFERRFRETRAGKRKISYHRFDETFCTTYLGESQSTNGDNFSLIATNSNIVGDVRCMGSMFHAGLNLSMAEIGGSLDLNRSRCTFYNPLNEQANQLIEHNIYQSRTVLGIGSHIGVSNVATASTIGSKDYLHCSLLAHGATIKGDLTLQSVKAVSGIDISDCKIEGSILAGEDWAQMARTESNSELHNSLSQGAAVSKTNGDMYQERELIPALAIGVGTRPFRTYFLRATRARIQGNVNLRNVKMFGLFDLSNDDSKQQSVTHVSGFDFRAAEVLGEFSYLEDSSNFEKLICFPENASKAPSLVLRMDFRGATISKLQIIRSSGDICTCISQYLFCIPSYTSKNSVFIRILALFLSILSWLLAAWTGLAIWELFLAPTFLSDYLWLIPTILTSFSFYIASVLLLTLIRRTPGRDYRTEGLVCNEFKFEADLEGSRRNRQILQFCKAVVMFSLCRPASHGRSVPLLLLTYVSCLGLLGYLLISTIQMYAVAWNLPLLTQPFASYFLRVTPSRFVSYIAILVTVSISLLFLARGTVSKHLTNGIIKTWFDRLVRHWFLFRSGTNSHIYTLIESSLRISGKHEEADSIAFQMHSNQFWKSLTENWAYVFSSRTTMRAFMHVVFGHGTRLGLILTLYCCSFLFGLNVFTNLSSGSTSSSAIQVQDSSKTFTFALSTTLRALSPIGDAAIDKGDVGTMSHTNDAAMFTRYALPEGTKVGLSLTYGLVFSSLRYSTWLLVPLLFSALLRMIPRINTKGTS